MALIVQVLVCPVSLRFALAPSLFITLGICIAPSEGKWLIFKIEVMHLKKILDKIFYVCTVYIMLELFTLHTYYDEGKYTGCWNITSFCPVLPFPLCRFITQTLLSPLVALLSTSVNLQHMLSLTCFVVSHIIDEFNIVTFVLR